jgi:hypothetical protein
VVCWPADVFLFLSRRARDAIECADMEWILILYIPRPRQTDKTDFILMHFEKGTHVRRYLFEIKAVRDSKVANIITMLLPRLVAPRRRLHKFFRPQPSDRPGVINLAGDF